MIDGWKPEPATGLIQLGAPSLKSPIGRRAKGSPEPAAPLGSWWQRSNRVGRGTGRGARINVGDKRGDLHSSPLSGQSGSQCEDVVNDDVGRTLVDKRLGLLGGPKNSLVWLERRLPGGEDGVFGRGRKCQPLTSHNLLPLPSRLQSHLVAGCAQRTAKRDHREGVARVAEGAEQQAHWASVCRQLGN
jgi:hypothetical protein